MAHEFQGQPRHITGISQPGVVLSGIKAVAAAGTAEALGSGSVQRGVYIRALSGNSGANVYIGDSSIDNTGFALATADGPVFLAVNDLSLIFIDVDTNGDGVSYVGS
jgi:hypothetical protein